MKKILASLLSFVVVSSFVPEAYASSTQYVTKLINPNTQEYAIIAVQNGQTDKNMNGNVVVIYKTTPYEVQLQNGVGVFDPVQSPLGGDSSKSVATIPVTGNPLLDSAANLGSTISGGTLKPTVIAGKIASGYSTTIATSSTYQRLKTARALNSALNEILNTPTTNPALYDGKINNITVGKAEDKAQHILTADQLPFTIQYETKYITLNGKKERTFAIRVQNTSAFKWNTVDSGWVNITKDENMSNVQNWIYQSVRQNIVFNQGSEEEPLYEQVNKISSDVLGEQLSYTKPGQLISKTSLGLGDIVKSPLDIADKFGKGMSWLTVGGDAVWLVANAKNGSYKAATSNLIQTGYDAYSIPFTDALTDGVLYPAVDGIALAIAEAGFDTLATVVADGLGILAAAGLGWLIASHDTEISNSITNLLYKLFPGINSLWEELLGNEQNNSNVIYAPVIYLYPTHQENINVKLQGQVSLTSSDPTYGRQWNVLAEPNGELQVSGRTYSDLFYEDVVNEPWQTSSGWVVRSSQFKTWALTTLKNYGLNKKETNDFIAYWSPRLKQSGEWLIAPQPTNLIQKSVRLDITPKPQSELRLWFVFKPENQKLNISTPNILPFHRQGYSVVEWGGILEK